MDTVFLVDQVRQGHEVRKHQEQLYARVRGEILPRIERRLSASIRARMDAEDVLHEAFLRAMRSIDVFRPETDRAFYAWVYSIAKNLLIDVSRRRSFLNARLQAGEERGGPRASRVAAPDSQPATAADRREWIETMLEKLRAEDVAIIRLHKLEERSFEEIATEQGRTPGAVQRQYSRAIQRFREAVEKC